ncbi:MAG TPA: hypothetical protein VNZ52_10805 [Candidatus Thermoplasmatota archaeon]|nr:hypothetical protein [Candidatus Thermoplasmatota archaeon]
MKASPVPALLALLLVLTPSAPAEGTALAYAIDAEIEGAVFEGKVPVALHANGTLEAEGWLGGYLKNSTVPVSLQMNYRGLLLRNATGHLEREEAHARVHGAIWGHTFERRYDEVVTYTPPLNDTPLNLTQGYTWNLTALVRSERVRDGGAPEVTEGRRTLHFEVLGNRSFRVLGENRTGVGIRMDFEPVDTDGRYWISYVEPGTGLLLSKSRVSAGALHATATLVDPDPVPAQPPPRGSATPAPGVLAVGALLASLAALRSRRSG